MSINDGERRRGEGRIVEIDDIQRLDWIRDRQDGGGDWNVEVHSVLVKIGD